MNKADRGDVNHLEDSPVSVWEHENGSGCSDSSDEQTDVVNFPSVFYESCHSPFSGIFRWEDPTFLTFFSHDNRETDCHTNKQINHLDSPVELGTHFSQFKK